MLLYQKERQREQAAPSAPTVSFGGAHSEAAAAAIAGLFLAEAKPSRCPMPKSWLWLPAPPARLPAPAAEEQGIPSSVVL